MGFYECIYDCGDGDYCVEIGSSIDNFNNIDTVLTCDKHNLCIGSKFKNNLTNFIRKHGIRQVKNNSFNCEILDVKSTKVKNGKLTVIQLKTDLDCSSFKESSKLYYSVFNYSPSWILDSDGKYIITILLRDIIIQGRYCDDKSIFWNWEANTLIRDKPLIKIQREYILDVDCIVNSFETKISLILEKKFETIDVPAKDTFFSIREISENVLKNLTIEEPKVIYEDNVNNIPEEIGTIDYIKELLCNKLLTIKSLINRLKTIKEILRNIINILQHD